MVATVTAAKLLMTMCHWAWWRVSLQSLSMLMQYSQRYRITSANAELPGEISSGIDLAAHDRHVDVG